VDRLLLIDDDEELSEMLRDYLGRHGFALDIALRGDQGLKQLQKVQYRLVLLDVMLPGMDGLEVLREIRRVSQVDVIMLTARGEDVDRIVGLEMGADDYVPKPFNARELLARIRAVQRRKAKAGASGNRLESAGIVLDKATRSVQYSGKTIDVTTVEFDLLGVLLQAAGQVVTREVLVESALGRGFHPFDRSLDMHISRLRRKLEAAGASEPIKTVRSLGYQFAVPLKDEVISPRSE
jgi:DNA-binding response OmpR family regulator